MFGTVKLTRNDDESKFIYGSKGIAFDGTGSWNSANDFIKNVAIFGVADNQKNNLSVLGKGPIHEINCNFGVTEKNTINLSKQKSKFCLHYNLQKFTLQQW